jgi:hypothetical protein
MSAPPLLPFEVPPCGSVESVPSPALVADLSRQTGLPGSLVTRWLAVGIAPAPHLGALRAALSRLPGGTP